MATHKPDNVTDNTALVAAVDELGQRIRAAFGDQAGSGNPLVVNGEVMLYGDVGANFWGDGFSAADVRSALAEIGRTNDVTVHINSGGGFASEGVAIYNALKAHGGKVSVVVDAMAASAASIIAMGGVTCRMATGAIMMIHDPSAMTIGTAADHQKSVEMLDVIAGGCADIYAAKSGKTSAECRADMKSELWMTADEAIAAGYADAADPEPALEPAAWNYRAYAHAPASILATADARGWAARKPRSAAAANAAPNPRGPAALPPKETPMTEAERIAAEAAQKAATDKAATDARAATSALAGDIIAAATAAGVPAMAAVLVKEGVTLDQAKARIGAAKDIRAAVAVARKSCPTIPENAADEYIAAGKSVTDVRADLFERQAAATDARPVSGENLGALAPEKAQEAEAIEKRHAAARAKAEAALLPKKRAA